MAKKVVLLENPITIIMLLLSGGLCQMVTISLINKCMESVRIESTF